jgi:enoyl-CoA hydratase/carnithine racemase
MFDQGAPLLSRLHRKAEALDSACLRALGHPHDHAIRQELLSALEWDASLQPDHARSAIRELFKEVRDRSLDLAGRLRSDDNGHHPVAQGIERLRASLTALTQILATRHDTAPKSFTLVRLSAAGRVGWLEFNRPPVNAFTREMVDETHDAIAAALADPGTRVLVLASAVERYFSAGADLNVFKGMGSDGMRRWATRCHDIVRLLRGSPKPLLAAINGTAVGGGLEMTLHCDVRFAATDARLGQPEVNIGFIPPIATTQALARLIGRPRAIRYLYDGALVPAAEALAWGLVDELVEPAALRAHVQAYAEVLAARSPSALAAIRRTVTLGGGMTFDDGMKHELETVVALAGTPDFAEGVDAFLAKRPPNWKAP